MVFIHRPLGASYLVLWAIWWVVTWLGRQQGVLSAYEQKQHPIIIAVSGIALLVLIVGSPWEYASFRGPIPRDGPVAWAGIVLFVAGIVLQSIAMWNLRGFYTRRLGVQLGHRLITSGPYRFIRHPGYLSYILSLSGIGLALSSLFALGSVILVVSFLLRRIKHEEQMLATEFGEEYRAYIEKTKWRLMPLIY